MISIINKINLKYTDGDPAGNWQVLIDQRNLIDLIEDSMDRYDWKEKAQATIYPPALSDSLHLSGSYPIIICRNCKNAGLITSEDLGLDCIEVTHDNDYISWKIVFLNQSGELTFKFHQPQYSKAINILNI